MLKKLLGSRLRARVLGWLFTHPDERFFVRQLQTLLGEDKTNLSRELARLAKMGVLTSCTEGRQKYYQANRNSPIFSELQMLVSKTIGVADMVRSGLAPLTDRIDCALIYGSLAAGQTRVDSDVDLLVVGVVTFAEVVSTLATVQEDLGREINPSVFPRSEFRERLAAGDHFLRSVLAGPKIMLIGDERELTEMV